jgi:hypothetical protein
MDYPELRSEHVRDARLFADRFDLVASLALPSKPVIAEVGVALGEFSCFLIETFRPSEFHAFDLFQVHRDEALWGRPTSEVFGGMTHRAFYERAVSGAVIHEGLSGETLKSLPAASLDLAYIDGAHDYDGVLADARECARAMKPNGVLVFNDYIMHDPFIHSDYGVVQVVNQMVSNEGWKVIGLGLQKAMFCDIAITVGR